MLRAFQSQLLPQQNLGSYLHPQSNLWDLKNLRRTNNFRVCTDRSNTKLSNFMDLAILVCLLHQRMTTYWCTALSFYISGNWIWPCFVAILQPTSFNYQNTTHIIQPYITLEADSFSTLSLVTDYNFECLCNGRLKSSKPICFLCPTNPDRFL